MELYAVSGDTLTGIASAIRAKAETSDGYTPEQMAQAIEALPFFRVETGTMTVVSSGETMISIPVQAGAMMVLIWAPHDTFEEIKTQGTSGIATCAVRPEFSQDFATTRFGFHTAHNNGSYVTIAITSSAFADDTVQIGIIGNYAYKPGTYHYSVYYWEGWQ